MSEMNAAAEATVTATEVVLPGKVAPSGLRLAQRALPAPAAGQALVRVESTAVSFAESAMRRGRYYGQPPFPFVPGYDLVGIVEAVGRGVDHALVAPAFVQVSGGEAPPDQVRGGRREPVRIGGVLLSAWVVADDAVLAHQCCDPPAADRVADAAQFRVDPQCAVGVAVFGVDLADLLERPPAGRSPRQRSRVGPKLRTVLRGPCHVDLHLPGPSKIHCQVRPHRRGHPGHRQPRTWEQQLPCEPRTLGIDTPTAA